MISAKSFRLDLPEFGDVPIYPDAVIGYWIAWAKLLMNTARWGVGSSEPNNPPTTEYDFGQELFVAHNLVLWKQSADAAKRGGTPGVSTGGAVSSKSVGGVSVSYDTGAAMELNAGHWNKTDYGTRFIQIARMMGAGPLLVGVGSPPNAGLNGPAWPGPYPYPGIGGTTFG